MSATADFSGCPGRYVTVVIFCSGLYRSTSLSDVHLTTLVGYAANPRSPQSQEIAEWRRLDICLDGRLTHFMFLVNILLRWLHVVWYNGKRETEVGLSLGFEVLTAGLRARSICLRYHFPWKWLEEIQLIMGVSFLHRDLAVCTSVEITACILEGWWFDPESR